MKPFLLSLLAAGSMALTATAQVDVTGTKVDVTVMQQWMHRNSPRPLRSSGTSTATDTLKAFVRVSDVQTVADSIHAWGIKPIAISLDDYFVDREHTPKDENGEYDYESLYALNIPLLNQQMNDLFNGKEIELPKYNFQTGRSEKSGKKLKMHENDVLVVEGIHALNPELTAQIPDEQIFRVYASAFTTILLDSHNYVPTTDNRLLRRIIRDYKYRGVNAMETIHRWPSVRAGENKWIFPFQENADAMFNTAMIFELAVIKQQAVPLLEQVPENCDEYSEAYRLLKFLKYFKPMPYDDIPPTSLLREFLGSEIVEMAENVVQQSACFLGCVFGGIEFLNVVEIGVAQFVDDVVG